MLDHNLVGAPFLASEDAVTMDEVFRGAEEEVKGMCTATLTLHCKLVGIFFVAHEKKWLQDGKGLIAAKSVSVVFIYLQFPLTLQNSGLDAGIKMRPTNEELLSMPEFNHRWSTFFANAPDKPVMFAVSFAGCVNVNKFLINPTLN